jgi:hypothetical protein
LFPIRCYCLITATTKEKIAKMARLRIPLLIFLTVALSAQLGFSMQKDVHLTSGETATQSLNVRFVDSSPAATGWNGFVDRQYFIEPNIHVVEGWARFPRSDEFPRLSQAIQIYAGEVARFGGGLRFQRKDVAGIPGAQGFIIYGFTSGNSGKQWCVVIPSDNALLQLGGSNC